MKAPFRSEGSLRSFFCISCNFSCCQFVNPSSACSNTVLNVSTCQCLIAYSATRLLPSRRKPHPCARRLDVKPFFFKEVWLIFNFLHIFCIVSCVSASGPRIARRPWKRRGRFPAGRTCIFKRLKGSLFWCLFNSESPANIATSCVSPESAIHTCEASHFELHESNDCQDL